MKPALPAWLGGLLAAAALWTAGCASTPPSRQYVLSAPEEIAALPDPEPVLEGSRIAIARIRVPSYVDRPFIVTWLDGVELEYAEFHRWGQPLADNLEEVIQLNLIALLPGTAVVRERFDPGGSADDRVAIRILRWTARLGDRVQLSAEWTVTGSGQDPSPSIHTAVYTEPLPSPAHREYVAALNRIAFRLSRDIARSLVAAADGSSPDEPDTNP